MDPDTARATPPDRNDRPDGGASSLRDRTQVALDDCAEQIRWFERHSRGDWWLYRSCQVAIVVLSGSTPVLLLLTDLPKAFQALPAATAAVIAAVAGSFHWHEDAVRWAATRELLKSELRQFRTRTDQYHVKLSDEAALDRFVTRVESLVTRELEAWRIAEQPPHHDASAAGATTQGQL